MAKSKRARATLLAVIALFCASLTSCIDYTECITFKDGCYHFYQKIALSKTLLALINEDADKYFEKNFGPIEESDSHGGEKIENVNTELEIGREWKFSISAKTNDAKEKKFLPTVSKNKVFIPFMTGDEENLASWRDTLDELKSSDEDTQQAMIAFLSASKCRVVVGKNIIPRIEAAFFEGKGGQDYAIAFFDWGESYCFEIPFVVLLNDGKYKFDKMTILR